jgi:Cof subfamily protein (haloacid dehalogenase superfamily)
MSARSSSTGFDLPRALTPAGRYDQWAPEPPRYVLCDVDGTLVDASGGVHADVREAATRAVEAGIHIGFATGRGGGGLRLLQERLALPGPHVIANGGQVRMDGRAVHSEPLDRGVIDRVRGMPDAYAEYYTDEGFWATDLREAARPHWELLGEEPLGTVDDTTLSEVVKITVILFGEEGDAALLERLHGLPAAVGEGTAPATPGLEYVNLTHPRADKGTALRAAAETLGVAVAATVAVGDERNDLPMLEVAGTAIAMGQAGPAMVSAAHLLAPDVERQGLAAVLDAVVGWSGGP